MVNTQIIKDPNSERCHLNWKECNSQSLRAMLIKDRGQEANL